MTSNYKRLGDFIEFYNIRAIELDKNLDIESIRGISSISKSFIKTKANLVGVVADKYKVVTKNCFAYNPNTARMGDRIPIALNTTSEIVLVSSIYPTFKIVKTNELVPEYLMMWFKRCEFDRYARNKSHGSAREVFDIEEMNELVMPIPSIEKQQELVREYNTIQNRIALNNQLISKLEETAQAIYKQWFVDFEFPDENGKPYKSNGGKMVWCEELEKKIPEKWSFRTLGLLSDIIAGGDKPLVFSESKTDLCNIPVISNSSSNYGIYGYTNKANVRGNSITISARGAIIGYTVLRLYEFYPIVRLIVVKPKKNDLLNYLFYTILNIKFDNQTSSAQGQLTIPDISSKLLIRPDDKILSSFQKLSSVILDCINFKNLENQKLEELKELLLGRMVRVEN